MPRGNGGGVTAAHNAMESSAGVWEGDGGGGRGRWGWGEECVEADGGATKQVLVPQARRGLCVRATRVSQTKAARVRDRTCCFCLACCLGRGPDWEISESLFLKAYFRKEKDGQSVFALVSVRAMQVREKKAVQVLPMNPKFTVRIKVTTLLSFSYYFTVES